VGLGISFQLQHIDQKELKTLTFSYSRTESVRQQYAPQGFIGLLASDVGPGHFVEVDLDDPFFRELPIVVSAPGDFTKIGMQRIDVRLTYGRPQDPEGVKEKTFTFSQDDPRDQRWAVSLNKRRDLEFNVQVDFNFDPQAGWRGERSEYALPKVASLDRTLMINPYDQFEFRELRLVEGDLDPSAVVSTDVRLRYDDKSGFDTEEVLTVRPGGEAQAFKLRLADAAPREVTYALEHHLVDGSVSVTPPETTKLSSITVNDPFPDALNLELIPTFPPGVYKQVFADITYAHPERHYRRDVSLTFDGSDPQRQTARIALFDAQRRTYHVVYTLQGIDGSIRRIEQDSKATRLFVGETF
jgi:hypothetical protein